MNLNKEELIFYKHLIESAYSAYHKEIRVYTDFLNLNEISLFNAALPEIPDISYSLWGGIDDAERRKICFHGDIQQKKIEIKDIEVINRSLYPITCIHIKPADYKFSETLGHRDYLGAILNLGLLRSKVGDIVIDMSDKADNGCKVEQKEWSTIDFKSAKADMGCKDAFIFCDDLISAFITDNLIKIRNTYVKASISDISTLNIEKKYELITGSVSSIRLDSIIKTAFHTSRSSILPYITGGRVLVNGREALSGSFSVKEGDIISVRGFGKFKFNGQTGITKKGRINISILKYI